MFYLNHLYLYSHRFAAFDQNGDGVIDFSEFVLSAGISNKSDLDQVLDFAFEM